MKKSFKILLLAAVLIIAVMSFASCASGNQTAADANGEWENISWTYSKDTNTLTLTGEGNMPDASNSDEIPWKSLRHSIKGIRVREGITGIGDYAFYGLDKINSAELPDGVTYIGKYSFGFCFALDSVKLPQSLTSIGDSAFETCTALVDINVPASVAKVGDRTFAFCKKLETVTFEGAVEKIGDWTFKNCAALKTVRVGLAAENVATLNVSETAFEGAAVEKNAIRSSHTTLVSMLCKDTNGNTVKEVSNVAVLENDEETRVEAPAIEGYTVDASKTFEVVKGDGKPYCVEFTYVKNEEEEKPTDAPTEAPQAPTDTSNEAPANKEDKNLVPVIVSIVVFALVIVGIAVGAFLLMRSNKKTGKDSRTVRKNKNENKKKRK